MSDRLKFQLRLTLSDEFAQVARNVPGDPSISTLTDILNRHDAVMKCQFDAFADYVSEAEATGIENFDLYEWTKKTIDDPAKKSKYTKSFALYVGGDEVYEKDKADALEAELKPLVGGPIVAKMFKYDTDPAHNPQPPAKHRPNPWRGRWRGPYDITSCSPASDPDDCRPCDDDRIRPALNPSVGTAIRGKKDAKFA